MLFSSRGDQRPIGTNSVSNSEESWQEPVSATNSDWSSSEYEAIATSDHLEEEQSIDLDLESAI